MPGQRLHCSRRRSLAARGPLSFWTPHSLPFLSQWSPQGPILLLRASLSSGCRGGGDRLTGHHANIALPTSLGGGERLGRSDIQQSREQLSVSWITCPRAPAAGSVSTLREGFASSLLCHPVCSVFAWLSKAGGLGFLAPILGFQPAGGLCLWKRSQAVSGHVAKVGQ